MTNRSCISSPHSALAKSWLKIQAPIYSWRESSRDVANSLLGTQPLLIAFFAAALIILFLSIGSLLNATITRAYHKCIAVALPLYFVKVFWAKHWGPK